MVRAALDGPARRGRPRKAVGAACVALLVAGLSGCAGEEPLAGLSPPHPNVPEVPDTNFPTVGTAASDRAPPLSPEAQQKLQKDLERLARDQGK